VKIVLVFVVVVVVCCCCCLLLLLLRVWRSTQEVGYIIRTEN